MRENFFPIIMRDFAKCLAEKISTASPKLLFAGFTADKSMWDSANLCIVFKMPTEWWLPLSVLVYFLVSTLICDFLGPSFSENHYLLVSGLIVPTRSPWFLSEKKEIQKSTEANAFHIFIGRASSTEDLNSFKVASYSQRAFQSWPLI